MAWEGASEIVGQEVVGWSESCDHFVTKQVQT